MPAYGRSKLLDVLFTLELAERLGGTGVTANCCCPGLVATGLAGTETVADRVATVLSRTPLVRRPEQGARVLVRLATEPQFAARTGAFISSTPLAGLLPAIPAVRDAGLRARLWEATESLRDARAEG
jgi:NAD(P)-dependent dehydrogenase (short-subunit alcohol dehydrogenase family)